ncbi:MAG TPA: SDR family oxidoreductase [Alphaproteobacteria bacterium]|nr:SDR family oxidoreductase [Alphaproteobacteria bacterium]
MERTSTSNQWISNMRLDNKTAVISGGAQGIGLAIARRFAAEGARVVLGDLQIEKGEAAAAAIASEGGQAQFVPCDVGDAGDAAALVAGAVEHFGTVDIAIANAGISHRADFLELDPADFERIMRVNLMGVFHIGQAAARQMVAQGEGGAIVNMASINALTGIPDQVPYGVSKAAVNGLTRLMAIALADKGIRVNSIGPGSVSTELSREMVFNDPEKKRTALSRTPLGRLAEVEEIAAVALFLACEDSSYVTGQCLYADGGRLPLMYTVPVTK